MDKDMAKITLKKVTIPQSQISKLSDLDKKRLIMLSAMIRDLNFLQKILLFLANNKTPTEVELVANETMVAFIVKNLISRIYEMKRFIQKNGISAIAAKSSSEELRNKHKDINNLFSDRNVENLFHFIRNKFGYHYEYENEINQLIGDAITQYDFEMWLSPHNSTNEIFPTVDKVILDAILKKMIDLKFEGTKTQLYDKFFGLIVESATIFREFCISFICTVFKFSVDEGETVELKAPLISETTLPLIVNGN